jgi:hypothetical protein
MEPKGLFLFRKADRRQEQIEQSSTNYNTLNEIFRGSFLKQIMKDIMLPFRSVVNEQTLLY